MPNTNWDKRKGIGHNTLTWQTSEARGGGADTAPQDPSSGSRLYLEDADFKLYCGDAREVLSELPDESVHMCVTSPPFFGLRDYGTGSWEGGDAGCDHKIERGKFANGCSGCGGPMHETNPDCHVCKWRLEKKLERGTPLDRSYSGYDPNRKWSYQDDAFETYKDCCGKCGARRVDRQIGLEQTPEDWVEALVQVFEQVRRVLRKDGTLWVECGDSYAAGKTGRSDGDINIRHDAGTSLVYEGMPPQPRKPPPGTKPKDLIGQPFLLAFALRDAGWVWRNTIIWKKPNPMPESVRDRFTVAHSYVLLFAKAKWTGIPNPLRMSREDAIWLAATMDAEGSICINRKTEGKRQLNPTYAARVSVVNTHKPMLDRIVEITGAGKVTLKPENHITNRPCYQWQVAGPKAVPIIDALEPLLMVKQRQAWLALELQTGNGKNGNRDGFSKGAKPKSAERVAREADIYRACSELNREGETEIAVKPWKPGRWIPQPYYFDAEAVREPHEYLDRRTLNGQGRTSYNGKGGDATRNDNDADWKGQPVGGRNARSVWTIATEPLPFEHYAAFPQALAERCIKAGTSERGCCPECGAPWVREVEVERELEAGRRSLGLGDGTLAVPRPNGANPVEGITKLHHTRTATTTGWRSSCEHDLAPVPATVLDPFLGSGTTALVARRLNRRCIGIELSEKYAALAAQRTQQLSLEAV